MEYINGQVASSPAQAKIFEELGELFESKLWHQLGCKISEVMAMDYFKSGQKILSLYEGFVSKCAREIDPLILVQIVLEASHEIKDIQARSEFVESKIKLVEKEFGPLLLLKLELASLALVKGDNAQCQAGLEEAQTQLDSSPAELPAIIPSRLYQVKMEYHKIVGTAADFFRNAILYLSYTPLEKVPVQQQMDLSSNLGLSALASDDQYNFGELLQHPILQSLKGSSNEWINEMLNACDQGSIEKFEKLYKEHQGSQPILSNNAAFLRQKIRIMNLMEMVFRRPSSDRNISFTEIAKICQITVNEVELLLMKAMSLGVIQGVIDEVDQIVRIKRVQPRVLNMSQVESLRSQLVSWTDKVHDAVLYLEKTGPELMTA